MFIRSIAARAGEFWALAIEAKRYSKSQEKPFPLISESVLTTVNCGRTGRFVQDPAVRAAAARRARVGNFMAIRFYVYL